MEAYFDNSATTRVFDSVKDIVVKTMTEDYGNPSAKHRKGMEAEQYVRQAAADIARTLKVRDKEILFTSGGTESNNMALIGTAWQTREPESTSSAPESNTPRFTTPWRIWSSRGLRSHICLWTARAIYPWRSWNPPSVGTPYWYPSCM